MTAENNVVPLRDPPGPVAVPGVPGFFYEIAPDQGIYKGGDTILKWCPQVSSRLVALRDDGSPDGVFYRVTVGADTVVAAHKEITTGEIWERMPDAYGTSSRTVRDVLAGVITGQGHRIPRTLGVTRTGWHLHAGERVYVTPDSRALPTPVTVELIGAPDRLVKGAGPAPAVADATVREALADVVEHGGWAPLFALAVGARSIGQSLRPVAGALVIHGDPNTGKTCTAATGRMLALAPSWPPVVTARFSDTPTDIECKLDLEADMATLIDDLALTADAASSEQRIAVDKLERIIRSVGNQEAVRGRRRRDLTAQDPKFVRSIPVITAQSLPKTMQASLYRRAVVIGLDKATEHRAGDAAWQWWKSIKDDRLPNVIGPALRTIGDRIIVRLAEADDPGALLAGAERAALAVLAQAADSAMPGWAESQDGMAGVVEMAAAMLSGLVLVAEAADVDPGPLLATVAAPLAAKLAVQADLMDDRRQVTDDLVAAAGDVLRAALLARRAHVAAKSGDVGPSVGPAGMTPQEMGVRISGHDLGGLSVWEGNGPSLYWLPDQGGVGIKSTALNDVMRAAGDPRATGYSPRSLVAALGRAGALVPCGQKGRAWSWLVDIGGDDRRLVILRPEVIWPDLLDGPSPETGPSEQAPTPPAPTQTPPVEDPCQPPAQTALATPPVSTAPPVDEHAPTPSEPPVAAAVVEPDPAGAALTVAATVDGLYLGDGRCLPPAGAYTSMSAFLDRAAELMGGEGTVVLTGDVAELLGYPDKAENVRPGKPKQLGKSHQECPAVVDAARAGWKSSAAGVGAWTTFYGEERPSVAVVVLPWLDPKRMRISGAPYLRADDDPVTAAYLLARYRDLTGVPYTMTAGTSGTAMIRAEYRDRKRTPGRRSRPTPLLKWDGSSTPAETDQEQPCVWDRPRDQWTPEEQSAPYVIGLDGVRAYLGAMSVAELPIDALEHAGSIGFDPRIAGYWMVAEQCAPYPLLPALTGRREWAGAVPLTTPTVAELIKHGLPEEAITDAWLPPVKRTSQGRVQPHTVRLFHGDPGIAERLRDAVVAIPKDSPDLDELRVRAALQATYREVIGMLRRGTPWLHRPDWSDIIIATWRTNLLRKAIAIGNACGCWPVRIDTDCLYYTSNTLDPAEHPVTNCGKPSLVIADRLGAFGVKYRGATTEFLGGSDA